jgi:hypothetical protein
VVVDPTVGAPEQPRHCGCLDSDALGRPDRRQHSSRTSATVWAIPRRSGIAESVHSAHLAQQRIIHFGEEVEQQDPDFVKGCAPRRSQERVGEIPTVGRTELLEVDAQLGHVAVVAVDRFATGRRRRTLGRVWRADSNSPRSVAPDADNGAAHMTP